MARTLDQLLDVQIGVVEGALGFAGRVAKGGVQFGIRIHAAHALAAASGHRLEQQGIAELRAEIASSSTAAQRLHERRAPRRAPPAMAICRAAVFDPMRRIDSADGPMKTMPASSQAAAKSAFSLRKP